VRKALMYALNREQLIEGVFPGAGIPLLADSIAVPGTPIGDAVARQLVRYQYEPARAASLLEDSGWRRGADGILTKAGDRFQLDLRGSAGTLERAYPLMQQDYRHVGIDFVYMPGVSGQSQQDSSLYPGLMGSALPANWANFGARWHTRTIARPENRFAGSNRSGYSNLVLDRIFDEIDRSIRIEDRLRLWSDSWRVLSDDVAVMSLYFSPLPTVVRKGLIGPETRSFTESPTWQIHTWQLL
jgi:peptide/nickel transport system substrate-binding protein